jgi:transposase
MSREERDELRRVHAQSVGAVIGVDAGKFHHVLVVRPRGGRDSKPLRFPTTQQGFERADAYLRATLPDTPPADMLVGIEFAGVYGLTLAHDLVQRGYQVVSVMPKDTKAWKHVVHRAPLKTDEKDAKNIADLVAQGRYYRFAFLDPRYAELRYLYSGDIRRAKVRTGTVNRLRAVLAVVWPEFESVFPTFARSETPMAVLTAYPTPAQLLAAPKRHVIDLLKHVSRGQSSERRYEALRGAAERSVGLTSDESALGQEVRLLVAMIAFLGAQREEAKQAMEGALARIPESAVLRTIPGAGTRTLAGFFGSVGEVAAYEHPLQVVKLAGLDLVARNDSGTRSAPATISKVGRPELRKAVHLLTARLVQAGQPLSGRYAAMVARNGGRKLMALVALDRLLLQTMFTMARDGTPFDPVRLAGKYPPTSRVPTTDVADDEEVAAD